MDNIPNKPTGYERLLEYFKQAQKEAPKGVSLKITGAKKRYIHLRVSLDGKERVLGCGCGRKRAAGIEPA
ncbi:MAG: hypothetical protein EAZ98_20090 [Oscillatoriales cyanobacterium]|uniref:Uncharacterized protein n=1 Tax=Microcoleus anatoxicus PTRS2 TaxID=2705321 RepID=A0ABU8YPA8_9CYAN|nr:MAG: hypothetical protein EA000_22890 [Oscillatoriales cyanobacterium]TAD94224.1 MAG: hypothetical protein EAZ98_20090 [Oscillatoriales cyanobacterium]TAE00660.1 MAG: hypothetical protein EAZ96_20760 [Oscillatoriales cyanobacterium]